MTADPRIDDYIASYPAETQKILQKIRCVIQEAAPDATEKMSYGIPTYWQKRNLIHFGGFEHHIGIYPGPATIQAFAKDIEAYETTKGTIKLPLDEPIPYNLLTKLTKHNLGQLK